MMKTKPSPITLITASVFAACLVSACSQDNAENTQYSAASETKKTSAQDVDAHWRQFSQKLRDYTAQERVRANSEINAEIQRMSAKIRLLEESILDGEEPARSELSERREAALEILNNRQRKLSDWASRLENSSDTAWDEVKEGFNDAYVALAKSIDEAEQDFEGDPNR